MHEGIYIAASAGTKQGRKMEVIAQNLANVNSTGYKGDRLAFKELMTPFPSDKGQEPTKIYYYKLRQIKFKCVICCSYRTIYRP